MTCPKCYTTMKEIRLFTTSAWECVNKYCGEDKKPKSGWTSMKEHALERRIPYLDPCTHGTSPYTFCVSCAYGDNALVITAKSEPPTGDT